MEGGVLNERENMRKAMAVLAAAGVLVGGGVFAASQASAASGSGTVHVLVSHIPAGTQGNYQAACGAGDVLVSAFAVTKDDNGGVVNLINPADETDNLTPRDSVRGVVYGAHFTGNSVPNMGGAVVELICATP